MIFKHKDLKGKDFLIFALIIFFALIFIYYSKEKIDSIPGRDVGFTTNSKNKVEISENTVYEQKLNLEVPSINTIGIMMHAGKIDKGTLLLTLKDGESVIHTEKVNLSKILGDVELSIEFKKDVEIDSNTSMSLEFKNIKSDKDISLKGLEIKDEKSDKIKIAFTYRTAEKDSFYYKYLIIVAAITALIILMYFLFKYTKISIEASFVIVMLVLGIVYSFVVKPLAAPDEEVHTSSAYRLSNQMLGIKDSGDFIKMREDDWLYSKEYRVSRFIYNKFDRDLFDKSVKDDIISTDRPYIKVPSYKYIVSGVGITVGRVLDFNYPTCIMIARFFNLLFYTAMVYFAIKWMPFGKHILYLISLIPVSLQQINSLSYDNFVYALAFFVIGLTLKIAYSEYKRKHMIMLIIACLILIPCKQFAYFPISLVPIIILWRKINPSKKTISNLKKLILSGFVFGVLLFIALVIYFQINPVSPNGTDLTKQHFTIPYLLSNPNHSMDIIFNTFIHKMDVIFLSMFGGILGYFTMNTQVAICAVFMMLIGLSALKTEDEKQYVTTFDKTVFLSISIICFAFIHMGMLLGWTVMSNSCIEGVQGRYFTPFLPLTILAFRGSKIVLKKDINKNLIIIALVLNLIVVTTILQNLM